MEGQKKRAALRRRRIVPRPRLTSALDASSARVRLLIGSAGYGKTTLAEQWTAQDGRQVAWYRVRDAAVDVAVLGVGLAEVSAGLVPGCDQRVRARTRASTNPRDETELLAEMLAEDLAAWPPHAWLVLDDYHALCPAPEAETFVETLVRHSPVNVLITSRCRPAWISSRNILYGDVFELSQTTLAMTQEEAQAVLEGWNADQASGLIALADGWPAVVGLAGVLPLPADPRGDVPGALYDFFAEEVFQTLEPDVRTGLATLAVAPVLDRELACRVLGPEHSARIVDEGLRTGILDERGAGLDLHPLARTFLGTQQLGAPDASRRSAIAECLAVYKERRDWDAVFALIDRNGVPDLLTRALGDSLDEQLSQARLASLRSWIAYATSHSVVEPIVGLAQAELSVRNGRHTEALSIALKAVISSEDSNEQYRLYSVAGRAAHVGMREKEALEFYRRAEQVARSDELRRESRFAQAMCAASLELEEAEEILQDLCPDVSELNPLEMVRFADKTLSVGFRFGRVEGLDQARRVEELLPYVDEPIAKCSFLSMYAYALVLVCDYQQALSVSSRLVQLAEQLRIDIALPYAYTTQAAALSGLRQFEQAHLKLSLADEAAIECNDLYGRQNAYAGRVRALLHEGRHVDACSIEPPDLTESTHGMIGEVWSSRGLALACTRRTQEAIKLASDASQLTRGVETRVLARAVRAVAEARSKASQGYPSVQSALTAAFESGATDLLVPAYRASPDLLDTMLSIEATRERAVFLLARAGDQELARRIGRDAGESAEPVDHLTAREREIYEFLCQGMSNRDIAQTLFISEATVKVHVQHVFDKVGIRSRRALAVSAALRRAMSGGAHSP